MQAQDLFVGLAAGGVGGFFLLGALFNAAWLMSLPKAKLLAESLGPIPARIALAALGTAVITIGVLIASGWRVHWS
jgi:hypothetical protein